MDYKTLDDLLRKKMRELADNYNYSQSDILSFYEKDLNTKNKDAYYSQTMVESYKRTMHTWRRVRYYMNRLDE